MRHFISTDAVVVVGIDMKNETTNVLILLQTTVGKHAGVRDRGHGHGGRYCFRIERT